MAEGAQACSTTTRWCSSEGGDTAPTVIVQQFAMCLLSQVRQYLNGAYRLPKLKPDWLEVQSGTVVAGVRCRGIALRDIPLLGKGPGLEMFEDRRQRLKKGVGWAFGTCQNTEVAESLPRESVHFMVAIENHEWLPLERRKDPRWCW
jgi:hypothetical protein